MRKASQLKGKHTKKQNQKWNRVVERLAFLIVINAILGSIVQMQPYRLVHNYESETVFIKESATMNVMRRVMMNV